MINQEIHREIHAQLLRRKNPNSLWGSLFDNAWVGLVLYEHKVRDEITINEILNFFDRQIHSTSISDVLKEERNIGAMSLYVGIVFNLKNKKYVNQIQAMIKERIVELDKKEKWKFGFFSSPEIFYSTVHGLAMSGALTEEVKEIFFKYASNEVKNKWFNKIYRFAFYSAALVELGVEDVEINKMVNFLISIDIRKLRIDEIIPLLWFIARYDKVIVESIGETKTRRLIEDKKDELWKQFESQRIYISYNVQTLAEDFETEVGATYSLSNLELGMIDNSLAWVEKTYEINPNEVFDFIQLHPLIKSSSEKLFKDGHYAEAIFEAYKALINYVKEKANIRTLDGTELMGKVFSVKYKKDKDLTITKKPILQLN
ncbi:MAG: TIGR02391 family protein, partial [Thermoproteota archaeon]